MQTYFVYILSSKSGVYYTGVTNDLLRRIGEHRSKIISGFTEKYNIERLLYYEEHQDIRDAIKREKLIKRWKREFKENLINKDNSERRELYYDIVK